MTNILVRLITNDDLKAAQRIQVAFDKKLAAEHECMAGHIVLYDLVWILQRLYGYSTKQCQQTVISLLGFAGLRFESLPVVLTACKAWGKHGGGWADHLIGSQMQALGCDVVLTLDKVAGHTATHRMV